VSAGDVNDWCGFDSIGEARWVLPDRLASVPLGWRRVYVRWDGR
jgi:hypothetical protein